LSSTAPSAIPDRPPALPGQRPGRARALAPLVVLCLPLTAIGIWLVRARGVQSLCSLITSLALLFAIAALIARRWRLFYLLLLPVLLLAVAMAIYLFSYDTPPGEFLAFVLATSTWEEIWGFFGLWQGLRWLLVSAVLAAVYLLLAARAPAAGIFAGLSARSRRLFLGAVAVLGACGAVSPAALFNGLAVNPVSGTALFALGPLAHARAAVSGHARAQVHFGAAAVAGEEVHILVIGESARRDSWSVYGYARQTTPFLETLRGEAVFLQHAVADANFTADVVPILLTGLNPADFSMARIHGNLVDLAQQAGYFTAWLMNQDPHISLLCGVHADDMLYPPAVATLVSGHLPLDETLLPALRRELARRGVPRFIGMHTIGSHWQYDSRYPAAFERFTPDRGISVGTLLATHADPRVLNAYDNTIAYTDWFLQQVIEQARRLDVPATVTYFADHGEDLYALDGNTGHGTTVYTRHQFEVPALIWMNAAFRQAHPERVRALEQNANREIRSHNLFDSMAQLMGIAWPGARAAQSFVSAAFVPDTHSPYIAGGQLVSDVGAAAAH
jgi:glucan phosphoethanolaminetransferase (alkaline phosphatase superfamily)